LLRRFAPRNDGPRLIPRSGFSRTGIILDSDAGVENTPAARGAPHILWAKDFPLN